VTIGAYYLLASQICEGLVAVDKYQECGGVLYNATTHFCADDAAYALCGGISYDPATEFCDAGTKYGKCGEEVYDPTAEYCSAASEVTALESCGTGDNAILYNPETHDCDVTDPENPSVTEKKT
jgi:hypothetical protein